jgi:hypothetical protein
VQPQARFRVVHIEAGDLRDAAQAIGQGVAMQMERGGGLAGVAAVGQVGVHRLEQHADAIAAVGRQRAERVGNERA